MCINQLLLSEQIALMRFAVETDSSEIVALKRKLYLFEHLLHAHPYQHRPYRSRYAGKRLSRSAAEGQAPPLTAWENEGGSC